MKWKSGSGHLLMVLALLVLVLTSGCQTTSNYAIVLPVAVKLNQFKSVQVEMKTKLKKPPDNLAEYGYQLANRVNLELKAHHDFSAIYSQTQTNARPELRVVLTFIKLHDVTQTQRVFLGGLLGDAQASLTLDLINQATGEIIGSAQINAMSRYQDALDMAGGGQVDNGITPEVMDRAADEVVNMIEMNR